MRRAITFFPPAAYCAIRFYRVGNLNETLNRLEMRARRFLRRTGVTPAVKRLVFGKRYEPALEKAMRKAIRHGDVIWDVGANIGHFSARFARWTGPGGTVYAFEPAPDIAARLKKTTASFRNVRIIQQGLSSSEGDAGFLRDGNPDGATSRIATPGDRPADAVISVTTGDLLVERGAAVAPDVIKMDIEGHEYEALLGIGNLLKATPARHIFIEVHIFLFERQGRSDVPGEIENFLRQCAYDVNWVDNSHLHAFLRH